MTDLYQTITDRITIALEAGSVPWHRPWIAPDATPRNLLTKRPYRGINLVLLGMQPFDCAWWVTYRQAGELGGHVRKGEKGSLVVFWKILDDDETDSRKRVPLLKSFTVFNAQQCDGLEVPAVPAPLHAHERITRCEQIVARMPQRPTIIHHPSQACYIPARDCVLVPQLERFETPEAYYGTVFHELVHSTGHATRLSRPMVAAPAPFGTPDYCREELVAEFGAAFLAGTAGIFPRVADNSAAYIAGWLSVLRGDRRLLPIAAAQAQKAADFILGETTPAQDPDSEMPPQ